MNLEKLSTECIKEKIKSIKDDIKEYENNIIIVKSQIYVLYIRHLINNLNAEMHKYEAELEWRKNHEHNS